MNQLSVSEVLGQIQHCLEHMTEPGALERADALVWPAIDQFSDLAPLWFYGGAVLMQQGKHAIAVECFQKSYALQPNPCVFGALGAAYRLLGRNQDARTVLLRGLEALPEDGECLNNLASSYVNEGDPLTGIEYGERAFAAKPSDQSGWNLALLHLEASNFKRGFDLYATNKHQHREERDYALQGETEPPVLTPALHEQLRAA